MNQSQLPITSPAPQHLIRQIRTENQKVAISKGAATMNCKCRTLWGRRPISFAFGLAIY